MLMGINGCGKQSLTKIASFILKYQVKQIEVNKDLKLSSFKDFLKTEILLETGEKNLSTVFIVSDSDIIEESYLELINNLLNRGEIPNLWELEEKDKIIRDLRQVNKELGRVEEPDIILTTFIERCRNNLHVVLNFSPIGP
jgi:dynein heavy chain